MIGRRRPLLRAAAVGGGAYYAGKRHAENQAAEQNQQAQIDQLQYQQAQQSQQAAAPAGGLGDDAFAELEKLAKLKEQGILTQEEFDAQKARILASA